MEQSIVGFHRDEDGDWVAELSCGHAQHIRHRPPFEQRPWVLDEATRNAKLDTSRDCPLCDVERGGDPSCYAHLVCGECGTVLDGSQHAAGCPHAAEDRPPLCPACGVTMLPAALSASNSHGVEWICLECEDAGESDAS